MAKTTAGTRAKHLTVTKKPKSPPAGKRANKPGRDFEIAVHQFVKALDPNAEVIFDYRATDRDTGEPIQCDVWINARLLGHFPVSALVSCKDHGRKLHKGDIGTFIEEVRSTGATMGVIYSRSGFFLPALKKAKVNRIACCRLFRNEPSDLPESVFYFGFFLSTPQISVDFERLPREFEGKTWNDFFDTPISTESESRKAIAVIAEAYVRVQKECISHADRGFPPAMATRLEWDDVELNSRFGVLVTCGWRRYRGKEKATLVNGSYCIDNSAFTGRLTGPAIDTQSIAPGPDWEEITGDELGLPDNRAVVIAMQDEAGTQENLRSALGLHAFPPSLFDNNSTAPGR